VVLVLVMGQAVAATEGESLDAGEGEGKESNECGLGELHFDVWCIKRVVLKVVLLEGNKAIGSLVVCL